MGDEIFKAETVREFREAVEEIVGTEDARRYAAQFEPLGESVHGEVSGCEALAMFLYTTPMAWHEDINRRLWTGAPGSAVRLFERMLNSALSKQSRWIGLAYRGVTTDNLEQFTGGYPVGHYVTARGFTSCARRIEGAFRGNVLFTIHSRTAAMVWMWKADYMEDEVIFQSGRTFEVLAVESRGDTAFIALDEV